MSLPKLQGGSFDGRRYTWTPTRADVYNVVFRASDGQNRSTHTVTITVLEPNRAPTLALTIDSATIETDNAFTTTALTNDPDGDSVTVSIVQGSPAAATFTDGVFSWTPVLADIGLHSIIFSATDNQITVEDTLRPMLPGRTVTPNLVLPAGPLQGYIGTPIDHSPGFRSG